MHQNTNRLHQNRYPQISRTHPAGRLENLAGDGGATGKNFGLSKKILQNIHLDYLFPITGELVLGRFDGKCFHVFRLFCCLGFISVLDKDWCKKNLQNFWEKIAVKDQLEPKYKYVAPKFNDIQWNNIIVRKSTKKIFFNLHIHEI